MTQEIVKENTITTVDNPFNPFTKFNEWFRYDCDKGYNTCALIDRISTVLFENKSTLELNEDELLIVFKEIVKLMPNFYKIVSNETLIEQIPIKNMNIK